MIPPNPDLPIVPVIPSFDPIIRTGASARPIGAIVFYETESDANEDAQRLRDAGGFKARERAAFEDVALLLPDLAAEAGEEIVILDAATGRVRKSKPVDGCSTFSRECYVVGYR